MMMNKRLTAAVSESKKYIGANVLFQWIALLANIALMTAVTTLLALLFGGQAKTSHMGLMFLIAVAAVVVRFFCNLASARMGYLSSRAVKSTLREKFTKSF